MTAIAAAPTASGGAQITFSLSSAAEVRARILNIAGRLVRTLCRASQCQAGTNALLWNAQSDSGLPAPNGICRVDMSAKAEDGGEARGLAQAMASR